MQPCEIVIVAMSPSLRLPPLWSLTFTLLAGIVLGACSSDPAGQDCTPGITGCVCAQNMCYPGLVCVAGYCIQQGSDETGDSGDGDGNCDPGLTFCGTKCVDTQQHPDHCGGCNMGCLDGEVCVDGDCDVVEDCLENGCPGFSYCDPGTETCMAGCGSDIQCESEETCNLGTHECECAPGYKLCSNDCIEESEFCDETCGNGALDDGETCDGALVGGLDCTDFGHDEGTLGCLVDCSDYDDSSCYDYECGNGMVDPNEACDDGNVIDDDGCSADCSCPSELLGDIEGWSWYAVQAEGFMYDDAVLAACQSCGLDVPCAGPPLNCEYSDNICVQTNIEDNCGDPLEDFAVALCGGLATDCPPLEGVYQYMGQAWINQSACGVEGSLWCAEGSMYMDRKALCVAP
jgi:cysteine-rich repeat protein